MEHTNHNHSHGEKINTKTPSLFLSIITGSLIIASSIVFAFYSPGNRNESQKFVDPDSMFLGREFKEEEFVIGSNKNKVILVEYSDLECPFCKKFHTETTKEIYEKYDDQMGIVYRHFPLPFHKKAGKEAEATMCAREQGGQDVYRNYISKIFENTNGNDSLDHALLPTFAADLGLDVNKWVSCMASSTYASQVNADLEDGQLAGVQGTPNTFVLIKNDNDEYEILTKIEGARNVKYVSAVIDQALKIK